MPITNESCRCKRCKEFWLYDELRSGVCFQCWVNRARLLEMKLKQLKRLIRARKKWRKRIPE